MTVLRPRALVLDFDGVILESVDLKTKAMRRLFADHPAHLDAIARYHTDNAGMSRYDKFRHFYETLFREPLPDEEMNRLDRAFGALVAGEIDVCPFVAGAPAFLEARAAELPLFIASGTPQPELRDIVARRGLAPLFAGVYGSPASKAHHLRAIAAQLQTPPATLLFVGDGRQDFDAAAEVGSRFIGRVPPGEGGVFPRGTETVADLDELAVRWESLRATSA